MKLQQIIQVKPTLEMLFNTSVPFKLAYTLAKLSEYVNFHMNFYQAQIKNIFDKHLVKEENGQYKTTEDGYVVLSGHEKQCESELNDLLALEVEDPSVWLTLDQLDGTNYTPSLITTLLPFTKE